MIARRKFCPTNDRSLLRGKAEEQVACSISHDWVVSLPGHSAVDPEWGVRVNAGTAFWSYCDVDALKRKKRREKRKENRDKWPHFPSRSSPTQPPNLFTNPEPSACCHSEPPWGERGNVNTSLPPPRKEGNKGKQVGVIGRDLSQSGRTSGQSW